MFNKACLQRTGDRGLFTKACLQQPGDECVPQELTVRSTARPTGGHGQEVVLRQLTVPVPEVLNCCIAP